MEITPLARALSKGLLLAASVLLGEGLHAAESTSAAARPRTSADFEPATTATNRLGLELFLEMAAASPGQNVLLSPFSIQSALAMAYAGAEGDTRAEMARVLHFPADDAPVAASFGAIRDAMNTLAKDSVKLAARASNYDIKVDKIEWNLGNRLFGQAGYPFREPFLAFLNERYGAPLEQMDFRSAAEPSRIKINAWVADQTHQKILDLIPSGGVNRATTLLLVNALYLKSPWEDSMAFYDGDTKNLPFQVGGTMAVKVPTMWQSAYLGYAKHLSLYPAMSHGHPDAKHNGYTAVTLPYLGGDLQFLILLPDDPSSVDALAATVTPALLQGCANIPVPPGGVSFYLPKFRLTGPSIVLGNYLQALGLRTFFGGNANFNRMAMSQSSTPVGFSEIFHQTYFALDEKGTEAAAATGAAPIATGAVSFGPQDPIEVHVDHPFLFAIQHRASGVCLFLGKVTDPR